MYLVIGTNPTRLLCVEKDSFNFFLSIILFIVVISS